MGEPSEHGVPAPDVEPPVPEEATPEAEGEDGQAALPDEPASVDADVPAAESVTKKAASKRKAKAGTKGKKKDKSKKKSGKKGKK